jgi:hypothetical protein
VGEWERPQHQRAHHAEHGSHGGDADGHDHYRERREGWFPSDTPERVSNVVA